MPLGLRGTTTPDPAAAKALTSLTGALLSEAPAEPASANQQRGGIGIGEVIGEGGTAQIRAGEQYVLARAVAIKELHAEVESRSSRELLLREARVTGLLEHPNIVPIHDVPPEAARLRRGHRPTPGRPFGYDHARGEPVGHCCDPLDAGLPMAGRHTRGPCPPGVGGEQHGVGLRDGRHRTLG